MSRAKAIRDAATAAILPVLRTVTSPPSGFVALVLDQATRRLRWVTADGTSRILGAMAEAADAPSDGTPYSRQDGAWVAGGGGGSGAPTTADYLVRTANAGLSAERVVTDTATVTWDWSTAGQAKASAVLGSGGALAYSSVSAYGLTLIDDVDAAAARTTLGLGTAATSASSAFDAAGAADAVTVRALHLAHWGL